MIYVAIGNGYMSSVFEENSYILVNEYPSCSGSGQENNPQRQHKIRRKKCKYMVPVLGKKSCISCRTLHLCDGTSGAAGEI